MSNEILRISKFKNNMDSQEGKKEVVFNTSERSYQPNRFQTKFCNYCNRKGHSRDECRTEKRDRQQQRPQPTSNQNQNQRPRPQTSQTSNPNRRRTRANYVNEGNQERNSDFAFVVTDQAYTLNTNKYRWIIDSGSTSNICNDRSRFSTFTSIKNRQVEVANKKFSKIKGVGSVHFRIRAKNGSLLNIRLSNVLYVPELASNLFSVKKFTNAGHSAKFEKDFTELYIKSDTRSYTISANMEGQLQFLDEEPSQVEQALTTKPTNSKVLLWHARLGHLSFNAMKVLLRNSTGIDITPEEISNQKCEICIATKMQKIPFEPSETRPLTPFQEIHSDVAGPMRSSTLDNDEVYVVSFICRATRLAFIYLMKRKSEVFEKFQLAVAEI